MRLPFFCKAIYLNGPVSRRCCSNRDGWPKKEAAAMENGKTRHAHNPIRRMSSDRQTGNQPHKVIIKLIDENKLHRQWNTIVIYMFFFL